MIGSEGPHHLGGAIGGAVVDDYSLKRQLAAIGRQHAMNDGFQVAFLIETRNYNRQLFLVSCQDQPLFGRRDHHLSFAVHLRNVQLNSGERGHLRARKIGSEGLLEEDRFSELEGRHNLAAGVVAERRDEDGSPVIASDDANTDHDRYLCTLAFRCLGMAFL
jgi:hypothetical protein